MRTTPRVDLFRLQGEILRQHNILIHQEEVLRLLHVYYDYDYVTCPCSRATEACPECAAKEDKNGVYTMMSPVFCNLKDSVSPSTVQVPVHYYDSESPTIDVPVYYYSTVEPKMVSGNEKESRVSWVPVTKVIVLPQVLVIAVRQPTVAGTRTYTAQGVEC